MPSLTIREVLAGATAEIRQAGLDLPRLDAEVILAGILRKSRTDLLIDCQQVIPDLELHQFSRAIARRVAGEPVAYITGEKEFMSLSFKVDRNVLIPRPETEIVVEEALAIKPLCVIDVGTGSGAIAVSIAHYARDVQVTAIDISAGALEVAKNNAIRHGVAERISFLRGNLVEPLDSPGFYGRFDAITANLPYIPSLEMDNLPVSVRQYEPFTALDGGQDGLQYYRNLCPPALNLLKEGGMLLLEIGYTQAGVLKDFLAGLGYCDIEVISDLAGLDRVIKARKP